MSKEIVSSISAFPLEGVRALEISEIWAGPFCGSLLADMGAEFIKVESVQRIARGPVNPPKGSGAYPNGDPGERPWNRQSNFNAINRNKKGITLDLKTNAGVETFLDLTSTADVIFCNYARSVMEGFGLGYEKLRKTRPDIIFMLMPGYGNTGPYRDYRSMGMAIDAISGHSFLRGYPDLDHSTNSLVHHPDAAAAVNAVFALTTALIYRGKTGIGQFIDMSQAESFMTHMGEVFLEYQINSKPRERQGNRNSHYAPQGVYPCIGEDNWIAISIVTEAQWKSFIRCIPLPNLRDEKFSSVKSRIANHDELDLTIEKWTSDKDRYEVMDTLQSSGIPSGVVLNCGPDTYGDPHLNEREFFQIVDHPDAGIFPMTGPVLKFQSNSGVVLHNPSPCLGQHNDYVLGDILGYTQEKMDDLASDNVIGTVPLPGSDLGGSRRASMEPVHRESMSQQTNIDSNTNDSKED